MNIFVSVVHQWCTRRGRLCIEPGLQARQSEGAERPTRLESTSPTQRTAPCKHLVYSKRNDGKNRAT
eukprot:scaffold55970_cov57-Phaeocystis_antarctica.AAC.4